MSGASDKARFYLEQSIPQLREFEEKKIFNKDEIRTLVNKRSDFEHKVLSRGSQPIDFARYAAWEISLEALRQKRCTRLRIKGSSAHAGQARIFLIFDRGTRKHPGDLGLWMSYLEYTRESKAVKKFKTVMTATLRMHPTKAELWLYAAKWALEMEADMSGARSYMQRGTRFCTKSRDLWIEYAKLEMIYLAKICMRRRILGLDDRRAKETVVEGAEMEEKDVFDGSQDVVVLPNFKAHALRSSAMDGVRVDDDAMKDPLTTPALNGAIPVAIFDDAKKQPFWSAVTAEEFFNLFATFSLVPSQSRILQHVLDSMSEAFPLDPATWYCFTRQPVVGVDPKTAEFPMALASSLERLKEAREKVSDVAAFLKKTVAWIEIILGIEGLDAGIDTVLRHTLRKLEQ